MALKLQAFYHTPIYLPFVGLVSQTQRLLHLLDVIEIWISCDSAYFSKNVMGKLRTPKLKHNQWMAQMSMSLHTDDTTIYGWSTQHRKDSMQSQGRQGGHGPYQISSILGHFVLWKAVLQTNYSLLPVERFCSSKKRFGLVRYWQDTCEHN